MTNKIFFRISTVLFLTAVLLQTGCDKNDQANVNLNQKDEKMAKKAKPAAAAKEATTSASTKVRISTSKGDIVVELNPAKAPVTCANFLKYVDSKFYDGTIFHRVIKGFMIQCGGMTADMRPKQTNPPIINEAKNGLKNTRGTLAMARTSDPDSATSQFFINHGDNDFLDYGVRDEGYAVFGKVVEGMDVVDAIATVKTGAGDVPVETVLIKSISTE